MSLEDFMKKHQSSPKKESLQLPIHQPSKALNSRPFAPQETDPQSADVAALTVDEPHRDSTPAQLSTSRSDGGATPPLQPKLTIGAPNDPYEQEADRVAEQVVQRIQASPPPPSQSAHDVQRQSLQSSDLQVPPLVKPVPQAEAPQAPSQMSAIAPLQRVPIADDEELQTKSLVQRATDEGGIASAEIEQQIHRARGGGQSLAPELQTQMGQAMGADFSNVRIHTDTQSDQLNQAIQAKAFTTGSDVFFRQGAYQPTQQEGQKLIAHELTHVVQQTGHTAQRVAKQPDIQRLQTTNDVSAYQDPFMVNMQYVSGHGGYYEPALDTLGANKSVEVPSGTTVVFWLPHGAELSDWVGGQVEMGGNFSNLIKLYQEEGLELFVHEPGDVVPNYILSPGSGLDMKKLHGAKSNVVDKPYTLEELMDKYKGQNIHWCACRSVASLTYNDIYGDPDESTSYADMEHGVGSWSEKREYLQDVVFGGASSDEKFKEKMEAKMPGTTVELDGTSAGAKWMSLDEMRARLGDVDTSWSMPGEFEDFGAYSKGDEDDAKAEANVIFNQLIAAGATPDVAQATVEDLFTKVSAQDADWKKEWEDLGITW